MDTVKEENSIREEAVRLINRRVGKDQFYVEFSILLLRAVLLIANCIRESRRM
jgi:hypothetical protein